MKIIHFIYDDVHNPWCAGGGAYKALEINRRLALEGHDIVMVTGNYPSAASGARDGVTFKRLGLGRGYAVSRLTYTIIANCLLPFLKTDLIVNDISIYAPVFSFFLTLRRQVFIINHLVQRRNFQKFRFFGFLFDAIERLFLSHSADVIAISPSVAQKITQTHPAVRLRMIPCGIDEELLAAPFCEGSYILYFGRFDFFMKGIDVLLEAFAGLLAAHPQARLLLAGHASDADVKQAQQALVAHGIGHAVTIVPNVSSEKKRDLFVNAQFVVQPSRFEGWGISAVEAAACGKLCIGTDIDGLRDAIKEGSSGYLVPAEDSAALGRAMATLLDHKKLFREKYEPCKQWAAQFRWNEIALAHLRFYDRIVRGIAG